MIFLDCKYNNTKSIDWPGILLVCIHIVLAPSAVMLSLVGILFELDPFYFVFELLLPSPYYRSLTFILAIPLLRFFLGLVCVFERQRFITILLFLMISGFQTLLVCIRELSNLPKNLERDCMNWYIQLRVLLISGDYFVRHVVALLLACGQVIIISCWWIALKCGSLLPNYLIIFFYLSAIVTVGMVILILPQAAEISEASMEFVKQKRASYH